MTISAKKVEIELNGIALAVAAHVFADGLTTVKHPLPNLLKEIKVDLKNPALTARDIRKAIADWIINGFAVIKENCLRITRSGRRYITELAEKATAPPLLVT